MRAPAGLACALLALTQVASAQQAAVGISQRVDFTRHLARFDLPGRLSEVSGLAFADDGRLFAHGDERGVVYAVDPTTGAVDRGFKVGIPTVKDDFEALAAVGPRMFLASSRGFLYEFRVVAEGGTSPVRVTDMGLHGTCEVEGLAYHAASDVLLIACKTLRPGAPEVRIHRLPITPGVKPPPPVRVPWSAFETRGHQGEVNPSDIAVDPGTGRIVVLAAKQRMLFETDLEGHLLDLVRLSERRHPQPEGLALGRGWLVYIADEAAGGTARITVYGPRAGGPP